ncbi:MAG: hypothetical protein AVDCRST_MAG86-1715 [uncultured Truepera sp.]|uniref:Uncharacterized protein n=1 Tax=uncultured Truepera sp. TaxID=543023 RepID=A0A6J4VEB8_9DEIN|nr:MAG: hypothetical protein AVDCRST_MAG86-1715 [uncultured Truepera sp.]
MLERTLHDPDLAAYNPTSVWIGVNPAARNVGTPNLFGRKFGNHPQDLLMRVQYAFREGERPY